MFILYMIKFLRNIFEISFQVNNMSNPNGPVIQNAVWKELSIQQAIHDYYDSSYHDKWSIWLQRVCNSFIII